MSSSIWGLPTTPGRRKKRRGPATGGPSPHAPRRPSISGRDAWEGLDDLPWTRIHTRLDLVKEALKASLRSLSREQHFAIVPFASDARPLSFTRRPVQATPRNVARACKAVDGLSASGSTNLHRGIEIAFALGGRGDATGGVFVDPAHLREGFDTIFILTDGSPNVDSYGSSPGTTSLPPLGRRGFTSFALYAQADAIVRSVQRQNLFRRAEIHCIGMGSSPRELLRRLAGVGGGQARFLGR